MSPASTKVSRTQFALGSGAAYAALAIHVRPAGAAEFEFKLAVDGATTHPCYVYAVKAADKIRGDSNGRVDIKVFPIGALGGQGALVPQARIGAIDFVLSSDLTLSTVVPVVVITGVPFAFNGADQGVQTLRNGLGAYLKNATAKAAPNLILFDDSWDAGFRQMLNGVRPIVTPDDLKGLRMRTPPSQLEIAMFKAFGAAPTAVDTTETYVALQTHLVDGLDEPLIAIESNKRYEVSKYVSVTNHLWTRYATVANTTAWGSLPKPMQDLVGHNLSAAAAAQRAEMTRNDAALTEQLKKQGLVFNTPVLPPFKKVLQASGVYGQWKESFGAEAWALLEKTVGKLA